MALPILATADAAGPATAELPVPEGADAWLSGNEAARIRLAARAATPPAVLHRLAQDPSATVRAAVAMNPALAPEADRHLLDDEDERIRILLAGKLAALLPGLSRTGQAAALQHVGQTLEALADDLATRVRTAMAAAMATMPEAPRAVMLRLARDAAHMVSDPVLRLCPLLTDEDLLDILATPPHDRTGHSVAARPGLGASVADRLADTAGTDVVRILLLNHSATIQERTLDALIGRASDHPEWHEALVRRPALPPDAVRALRSVVTSELHGLLDTVPGHPSLPPGPSAGSPADLAAPPACYPVGPLPEGTRREKAMLAALEAGDIEGATALLAEAACVPPESVQHAIALRSGKALVSLAWKAGFIPATAQALLKALGLTAGRWEHSFPFSAAEMEWQIELLDRPVAEAGQLPVADANATKAGSPRVTV